MTSDEATPVAHSRFGGPALAPFVAGLQRRWLHEEPDRSHKRIAGTLAFIDISGFTALSERLAGLGKVGAEELTGLLRPVFDELITIAYRSGGELIKWGGDAILVLYEGRAGARAGVHAALRMQEAMGRLGRLHTRTGPVTLRVSIGLHSGAFDFVLVGDAHRELLVLGPAASRTAELEAIAEAGEVAVSAELAASLGDGWIFREKGSGLLVAGAPLPSALQELDTRLLFAEEAPRGMPTALSDHLGAGPVEPEHRQVAVAFLELQGTDALVRSPSAAVTALEEAVSAVQRACAEHKVSFWETDISHDGVKVMLIAGAPVATEDDPGHLLTALREVFDRGLVLPLRAGVNHGRVFTGRFGPDFRRSYNARGDAVNVAARLMGKAAPGEIVASAAVLERSRVTFATEALPPFALKGKTEPVAASRVGALAAGVYAPTRRPPLVGREQEVAALGATLAAARAGVARVVELTGPAGIGKSRLLDEVAARARDDAVGVGWIAGEEYRSRTPYAVLRRVLLFALGLPGDAGADEVASALTGAVERHAPAERPWLPFLGVAAGVDLPPTPESTGIDARFREEQLARTVVALLGALLATPTLLVLDDAHFVDESSAAVLRHAVGSGLPRPWFLLVARRDGTGGLHLADLGAEALALAPLDERAVVALLRAETAARPLSPHVERSIIERGAGNPLFLLELAQVGSDRHGDTTLPDTVEALLAAEIDRLAPRERSLLRAAAVLGATFDPVLLDAMLEDGTRARLSALSEFLTPAGRSRMSFRHAALRDAAYEGLAYSRRRELHARAGRALEASVATVTGPVAALLALHFHEAGVREPAFRYGLQAGRHAESVFAPAEAAHSYELVLGAGSRLRPQPVSELYGVAVALGDARTRLGVFADAEVAFRRARRWAREPLERAELTYKIALGAMMSGAFSRSLRLLAHADRSLESATDERSVRLRAEIAALYGLTRHRQGRGVEAVRRLRHAVELAERAGDADVLATTLLYTDIAELTAGEGGNGESAQRALELYRRRGADPFNEARALNQLGIRAYFEGDWPAAVSYYAQSRDACARAGNLWNAALASANIAELLADQGDLERARPLLEDALVVLRAARMATFIAFATRVLGRLSARAGEPQRASALLEEAREICAGLGESLEVVLIDAMRAEALLLSNRPGEAATAAATVLSAAAPLAGQHLVTPLALRVAGVSAAHTGKVADAVGKLRASVDAAREHQSDYDAALSLQALRDVDPSAVSDGEWSWATEVFDRLGILEAGRHLVSRS